MNEKKMGRWVRSKLTISQSREVLRNNTYLYKCPIYSTVISLVVSLILIVAGIVLVAGTAVSETTATGEVGGMTEGLFALFAVIFTLVTTFVAVMFQGGMIKSISDEIDGQNSSFGEGMAHAKSRAKDLLFWALAATTVGIILRALQERGGIVGAIFAGLTSLAWAVVSIFVIPVIVLENAGVREAFGRSTAILKKTWGESLILNIGISFIFGLIILLEVLVMGGIALAAGVAGIGSMSIAAVIVGVGLIVVTSFVQQMYTAVFKVALYKYATTGAAPSGFDEVLLAGSVKEKKKKGFLGKKKK